MQTLPVLLNLKVSSHNPAKKDAVFVDVKTARQLFYTAEADHTVLLVPLRLGLCWIWRERSSTVAAL